jgi:hypothetical protein
LADIRHFLSLAMTESALKSEHSACLGGWQTFEIFAMAVVQKIISCVPSVR